MKKLLVYSLRWQNLLVNFLVIVGAFLFGNVIHEIIMNSVGADSVFPMGTFIGIMAVVIMGFLANWNEGVQQFNLAISMGETRRKFMISFAIQYLILNVLEWLLLFALYNIEKTKMSNVYRGIEVDLNLDMIFHPATFILVPLVIMSYGILIAAIALKLGANAKWIVMIVYLAICIGMSRISDGAAVVRLIHLPVYAIIGLICAICAVMLTVSVILIKKQQVNV